MRSIILALTLFTGVVTVACSVQQETTRLTRDRLIPNPVVTDTTPPVEPVLLPCDTLIDRETGQKTPVYNCGK